MKILYINNFRGFRNTYIPFKDVNFLVGENSTGKTSVLSLIKLITNMEFWFKNADFNIEDVNLGHFKDIISINDRNANFFSIGLIDSRHDKTENTQINAFFLAFANRNGIPQPIFYCYSSGSDETRIRLTHKQTKYKKRLIPRYEQLSEFIEVIFSDWILSFKKDTKGYKVLPKEMHDYGKSPLLMLASLIDNIDDLKDTKQPKGTKQFQFRFPVFPEEVIWLAPIRTRPHRTYDEFNLEFSSEGAHTPYLIKNILEKKSISEDFKKYLDRAGRDSGLFDSIKTKTYGRGATAPFELDIILTGYSLSINNVGYGVSQALPVIVEAFTRPVGTCIAIQQPEVHLHPKAQAALGDIFFDLSVSEDKKFIVETHSDYTIDRFRLNYKKPGVSKKPQAQILYFERYSDGNKVYQIEIQEDGELPEDQPQGYRDFFIKEELNLLGL